MATSPRVTTRKERATLAAIEAAEKASAIQRRSHPLYFVLDAAVQQATGGKGERHGGEATPFYDQKWVRLGETHGNGFLTGQAAKKIEEAVETLRKSGAYGDNDFSETFEREILGAIVYLGMALLQRRGYPTIDEE